MTIDSLFGEPAEFTDDLHDPESDAYRNATKILHPFIEKVISDTDTAADVFLFTDITQFTPGSIKVAYTVTLEEGTMLYDKTLAVEMNEALILQDNPDVSVRNGSLSVVEHQEPISPPGPLNMVIFTYVGCCVATFMITITIVVYIINKHLLKSLSNKILLSFCVSLLGLYVSYIVLIAKVESGDVDEIICNVLAGVVHYFALVTASWTVMEGIAMCCNYKSKLDGLEWCFVTTASLFAWGVPAIIVIVTSLITKQDYSKEDICFLKQTPMIASVIVPLAVVITVDGILFIYAAQVFVSQNDPQGTKASDYGNSKSRLKYDVIVVLLLTLNYVVGYLALVPSTQYIAQPFFCFLSIVFGISLFFLFVVRQAGIFLTTSSSLETSEVPDSIVNAGGVRSSDVRSSYISESNVHPDSVPMAPIEQKRFENDSNEGCRNAAFNMND
ncbi:adhesion G-protein coupled receptor G7-like [Amphiura filiformis]|uniref:adhesion G-protein coupled receptor G7-like n=1 Tax=Amphiura filiformis TaxID=82378 RepID=UPI003B21DAF9